MAWCPNCKTEYRDGVTKCADCGADLVDELKEEETICVATFEEKRLANKFQEFLIYSEIEGSDISFDPNEDVFVVNVTSSKADEAKKLFETFKANEANNEEPTSEEELEEEFDSMSDQSEADVPIKQIMPESTTTYVKKKDRYADLRSTFWIFIVFGIGGLIFTGLNMAEVITFLNNYFQYTIMSLVSLFFIFVAIKSLLDSKRIYHEIDQEEESTEQIKKWLQENMTKEALSQFDDDSLSPEIIYLKKTEYMKAQIYEAFDIDNDLFTDEIIEEYYNEYIE
ncbi:MAG: hypothetical protein Q4G58_05075 [bacterium]|nr:hypothetical protein [bacterium]